jgi:hypothetical protein
MEKWAIFYSNPCEIPSFSVPLSMKSSPEIPSENSPELKAFIRRNAYLFWYTPDNKKEDISHELLVEHILNNGTLDAVRELFEIMGINTVAKVFFNAIGKSERKKGNYHELTINYFTLIFKQYAS